ncbi:MAG: hypothetical protein MI806_24080 [Minwuiales bacterium]|nr:hypothetical protein [Minwuiales bacterium]
MAGQKIDVLEIAVESYRLLFENFRVYVGLARWPFLFLAGMACLLMALDHAGLTLAAGWVFSAIEAMVIIPVATAWHRLVLLGFGDPTVRSDYSFDWEEWLYIKRSLVLLAIWAAGAIAFYLAIDWALKVILNEITALLLLPVWLYLTALFTRLCLTLPAAAIGKFLSLRDAFAATEGNTGRVALLYLLISLPPGLAYLQLYLMIDSAEGDTETLSLANFLQLVIGMVPGFLLVAVYVAALSLIYRQLFLAPPPAPAGNGTVS